MNLADLAREPAFVGAVAAALNRGPFARPSTLASAVVLVTDTEKRATSRGDFALWLRANDLHAAARECLARKVPPGCVLAWVSVDDGEIAVSGFVVVPILAVAREICR